MRFIFVSRCSKFNVDFENGENQSEKVFSFLDNCTWIGCVKFSQLQRKYLSSAVKSVNKQSQNFAYH